MGADGELLRSNLAVLIAGLALLAIVGAVVHRLLTWALHAVGRVSLDDVRHLMGAERVEQIAAYLSRIVGLMFGLGAVAMIGWFGYLTSVGVDAYEQVWLFAYRWTWTDVVPVTFMLVQFVAVLILLRLVGWLGKQLSQWLVGRLQAAAVVCVEDERVERIGRRLMDVFRLALWYVAAMVALYVFDISHTAGHAVLVLVEIVLIYCLVRLVAAAVAVAVDSIYESLSRQWRVAEGPLADSAGQFRGVSERVKIALQWAVYIAAATYLASRITFGGVIVGERSLEALMYDIAVAAAKIIGIWVVAMLVVEISAVVIHHVTLRAEDPDEIPERRRTVVPLLTSLLRYALYFVAAVMSLNTVGVDTTAILAGAGIIGLAVGFGAQNMVRDLVAGFFILFEGYYWVGDRVDIGDERGVVESITLRSTWLRAPDGTLQIIPNGEIATVINYSREFVQAIVEVGVSYEGDLEKALQVTEEAMLQLSEEHEDVNGPPLIFVSGFGDSSINLWIRLPVEPVKNWAVASEMRRRLKAAYDEHGIEIPFPRQVVMFQKADGEQVDEIPIRMGGQEHGPNPIEFEPRHS